MAGRLSDGTQTRGGCADLDPGGIKRPKLDRVGRSGGPQQNALAIPHDEPSVEPELELDPSTGLAAVARSSRQLEDRRPGPDRPVVGHGAAIAERADPVELGCCRPRSPGRLGVRRWNGKAPVEAANEPGEDTIGRLAISRPGEPELDDESILECPPQALDATLCLGTASGDRADPELGQGASNLGRRALVDELFLKGQGRSLGRLEDPVPVAVDGERHAVPANGVAQDREVTGGVLLVAERRPGHDPGRIVDSADEGQPWTALGQPVVATAVELDEEAGLGHPVTPAAVTWGATVARAGSAGRSEQALERRSADDDPVPFGQELGEVAVVGPVVHRRGQIEDPRPGRLGQAAWRGPPAVAVDDRVDPELDVPPPKTQIDRSERPSRTATSATVSSPATSRVRALVRRWSLLVIVIVSLIAGD